jgi:hypothetical protein
MEEHIHTFKSLCDSLAAIEKPVSDNEKVFAFSPALVHNIKTSQQPC